MTHLLLHTAVLICTPVGPAPWTAVMGCSRRPCDLLSSHYQAHVPMRTRRGCAHTAFPVFKSVSDPDSVIPSRKKADHFRVWNVLLLTVLRLPPGFEAVGGKGGDHVFDSVADGVYLFVIWVPGIAHKAFCLLLTERTQRPLKEHFAYFKKPVVCWFRFFSELVSSCRCPPHVSCI